MNDIIDEFNHALKKATHIRWRMTESYNLFASILLWRSLVDSRKT